jgi:hypothetical protein
MKREAMKLKKAVLMSLFATILSACATPQHIKEQAANVLSPACYATFTDGSLFHYQQLVHQFNAKVVFTFATDENGYVCAYASKMDTPEFNGTLSEVPWSSVETVALSRCEDKRRTTKINSPCEVFARNNDIIWGKKEDIKLQ